MNKLSDKKNQEILDLYFNSNDNTMRVIAEVVGCSIINVTHKLDLYFNGKLEFENKGYKIYHSKINNPNFV